ncbi:peptidyl-tRNA hydrolase (macronuclear) [Tetrahymena thermophila SB210]|uniref:peptidyl-tRNA hydrolase n=1 Tax=Tetrahymena thermophila (strain SB210) TaxID=312017 RepID=A4VCS2_TETTS|nr:peptidyl-tRNA hydrolase [Tetrahymena thermophila SB210]EDK31325.1 peptidyl-tRNA hydrolase [Tetrahymena thermophila SB210]|eukprot:XP_001471049.1 peptidyl-tRNA hydrolase [Tetrahymena thermophila SB210]
MDHQALKNDLLQLGFEEALVDQALALTQDKEKAVELIFQFQEDLNKGGQPDLSKVNLLGDLSPDQLLGMIPANQKQSSKNIGSIQVKDMTYPMGEDVDEVYYKMVFLVRMDLKMGTGKIAAQTGHAVLGAYQQLEERADEREVEQILDNWEECGCPKIVLKVDSKDQLLELEKKAVDAGLNTYVVCDAGKTQVEPGSITVCAIGPARADIIDSITGHLKLLN